MRRSFAATEVRETLDIFFVHEVYCGSGFYRKSIVETLVCVYLVFQRADKEPIKNKKKNLNVVFYQVIFV